MMPGFSLNWARTSWMTYLRGAAHGFDGQRGEEIGEHRAEQRADEDGDAGQVDVGEAPVCGH